MRGVASDTSKSLSMSESLSCVLGPVAVALAAVALTRHKLDLGLTIDSGSGGKFRKTRLSAFRNSATLGQKRQTKINSSETISSFLGRAHRACGMLAPVCLAKQSLSKYYIYIYIRNTRLFLACVVRTN